MDLTTEQFDMLYLRRSQEDLNLVIDALVNDGAINAPADSPVLERAKADQEAEREADRAAGGEGKTSWEKRKEAAAALESEQKKAAKEADKEAKAA